MRRSSRFLPIIALLALSACQVTLNSSDTDAGTSTDSGTTTDAASSQTYLRLAMLSPDWPAVVFCLVPTYGTGTIGPVLQQIGSQVSADGSVGLSFGQVSIYVSVPEAYYDVAIIPAGGDCTTTRTLTGTSLPVFSADSYRTLALVGDRVTSGSDPSLALRSIQDRAAGQNDTATVRFLHAVPSITAIDFGFGSVVNDDFQTLFSSVQFGKVGSESSYGTVDTMGYLTISAVTNQKVSMHNADDSSEELKSVAVNLAGGSLVTFMGVGAKTDDDDPPLQILQCMDTGVATGYLAPCYVVSQ